MTYAGFVLVGGRSSRMGRDKALLPYKSKTLLEHIAEQVLRAAGNVTLIGDPALYAKFGYPVYADRISDCGPLGGIHTALSQAQGDWNLIVACDLPLVCLSQLQRILSATNDTGECVVPVLKNGMAQPLCAVYHRRCLPIMEQALMRHRLRMTDMIESLATIRVADLNPDLFHNVNSPADWEGMG
jgi:molybdenum cofactor guanylyltransferase